MGDGGVLLNGHNEPMMNEGGTGLLVFDLKSFSPIFYEGPHCIPFWVRAAI